MFEKNKIVIRKHDDPLQFFILKEGKINIFYHTSKTKNNPINTINENQFFGEVSLIFNTLRTCDAIVESNTACCYYISKEYFLSLLNKDIVTEFVEYIRKTYTKGKEYHYLIFV